MTVTMASTTDARKPAPGAAYGCVRFVFVRGGTLILDTGRNKPLFAQSKRCGSRCGRYRIAVGIELGLIPEGVALLTTLYVVPDYLIEHLFRQHLHLIPDRVV
ncbi:hypothetical protein OOK41_14280 [Micromonospora sp. NBC_01655]|uniref:hypothetical protein n=1 Tax=Micromonospora sp. NBC_01655 TaxID=2975983 RepID=UPI002254D164|nr:hypothetical protein [Micromonospora sp. NBC_01655]MCX4471458.1 hypothetical protein [Micromonospora sp. NBC_01655]